MQSATRDKAAAKIFFKKLLANKHCTTPRVIGVDENLAYPPALRNMQREVL